MPRISKPHAPSLNIDLRNLGRTGLKTSGGIITEDSLDRMSGRQMVQAYKEMVSNDVICGTIKSIMDRLCRRVAWSVEAASSSDEDLAARDFVESCKDDMDQTWVDFISEALNMLSYGFSVHEKVYKRRAGRTEVAAYSSKYTDGRVGWRGFPVRAQETIYRWDFDDCGTLLGFEQVAPPYYKPVYIPMSKALLFRTTSDKNNPQGVSMFRRAYRAYTYKRGVERLELIGMERDLAGLPVGRVPSDCMGDDAPPFKRQMAEEMARIVTNVRRDEQEGLVLPSDTDENGEPMYDFKLLGASGSRQFDTDKVIQRYDQRIAMSASADFILLGQTTGSGSFAMHSDKTQLFAQSINTFLDVIKETLNRFAIPQLFEVNDFAISAHPKFTHAGVDQTDIKEIAGYLAQLSQSGAAIFPNPELENYLLKLAGLPTSEPARDVDMPTAAATGMDDAADITQLEDAT